MTHRCPTCSYRGPPRQGDRWRIPIAIGAGIGALQSTGMIFGACVGLCIGLGINGIILMTRAGHCPNCNSPVMIPESREPSPPAPAATGDDLGPMPLGMKLMIAVILLLIASTLILTLLRKV